MVMVAIMTESQPEPRERERDPPAPPHLSVRQHLGDQGSVPDPILRAFRAADFANEGPGHELRSLGGLGRQEQSRNCYYEAKTRDHSYEQCRSGSFLAFGHEGLGRGIIDPRFPRPKAREHTNNYSRK